MRRKHVPQRTCVACHQVSTKRELFRIVRSPTGEIQLDPTGKKAGRGAYLCRQRSCWEQALKGKHLERALKAEFSLEERAMLAQFAANLPEDEGEVSHQTAEEQHTEKR
jgi:predicted RNA-binding protein YlxR (DUF448 family)